MKTILIICSCLVSVCGVCQGQLSLTMGYATFRMADLKSFQEKQLHTFPVDAEITSSFPPYWTYGLSAKTFMREKLMMGVSGVIGSTGSRAYYEDYSGNIGFDQLLRFTSFGLHLGIWDELRQRKLYFSVDLNPGVTFTSMKLRSFQSLGTYGHDEASTDVRSLNVTVQPTLALTRRFGRFGINLFGGYHLTIASGKLKSKENKDAYLVDNRQPVKADWSGLRVGVSATVFLGRSSETEAQ